MAVISVGIRPVEIIAFRVTSNDKKVVDAEKIEIEEGIFGFFFRKTFADDMRNRYYAVFVFYGGSDGYRSRAAAYADLAQEAIGLGLVDRLAVVRSDIDEFGIKFSKLVYNVIYFVYAVAF